MKFSIPIPTEIEVQLVGKELTLIGPKGTKEWSGDRFFSMELTNQNFRGAHIVLTPHPARWATETWDNGSSMAQHDIDHCAFLECRVIESLIEAVK